MRSLFLLTALVAGLSTSSAQAKETNLFFYCTGLIEEMAISFATDHYSSDGSLKSVRIGRRGLYENYHDQIVNTEQTFKAQPYNPRNPKNKGLQKYVVDTEQSMVPNIYDWQTGKEKDAFDFSEYVFLIPPRAELEKIWKSTSDRGAQGKFTVALQLKYSSGDDFISGELKCGLNWKSDK